MGNRNARTGFTLIELAMVLIIIGTISAVLTPVIMRTISREKVAAGRGNLQAYVDRIIGYAVAGGTTGTLPTSPFGGDVDMWGSVYSYVPFGSTAICSTSSTPMTVVDGNTLSDIAFVVTSPGPNRADALVPGLNTDFTSPDDDIYQYVTLYELKALMCRSANGTSTTNPTGGGGGASEYVIYTQSSGFTVPNAGTVVGNVASEGDITLANEASVDGNVESNGNVSLSSRAVVDGDIVASGTVTLSSGAHVTGDIHAQGDVYLTSSGGGWHPATQVDGTIYTNGAVTTGSSVVVQGDINAGGDVELGYATTVSGDVITYGDISVGNSARIDGEAHAAGTISGNWASSIGGAVYGGTITIASSSTGAQHPGSTVPPRKVPTAPTAYVSPGTPTETVFTAGGADVTTPSSPLAPGSYGAVTIGSGSSNTLSLSAGTYKFKSLTMNWGSSLRFDLTGNGTITILVEGDVNFNTSLKCNYSINSGSNWYEMTAAQAAYAANIYLESHGTTSFSTTSTFFGTIYSTDGINFSNDFVLYGSYYTPAVASMSNAIDITYVLSAYAASHW